ncbi:MAG: hypothetical protein ACREM3_27170 [Candidatus Rokuibacteriota bacterium]
MDPLRTVIMRFLRAYPGAYCVECIAQEIGRPLSQVTMTVLGTTDWSTIVTLAGECERCRRDRLLARTA